MKDAHKLFEELKNRVIDAQQEQALLALSQELFQEFESGAAKGVASWIRHQIEIRQKACNTAYKALTQKMGL